MGRRVGGCGSVTGRPKGLNVFVGCLGNGSRALSPHFSYSRTTRKPTPFAPLLTFYPDPPSATGRRFAVRIKWLPAAMKIWKFRPEPMPGWYNIVVYIMTVVCNGGARQNVNRLAKQEYRLWSRRTRFSH